MARNAPAQSVTPITLIVLVIANPAASHMASPAIILVYT